MARLGLGDAWTCAFANDVSAKKASAYRAFFGECPELVLRDVAGLSPQELPGTPTLVWASFPCQDLSLAGAGAGLRGRRSGTFTPFWGLMQCIVKEGRAPKIIVLENVTGALTSHEGRDFETLVRLVADQGYRVGAVVMDAVWFLPQSRPRLFVIGGRENVPSQLISPAASEPWHTTALCRAYERLPRSLRSQWIWWNLPTPNVAVPALASILDEEPNWSPETQTDRLISLMSPLHLAKLQEAMQSGEQVVGTVYKRTRGGEQRAEVRFDQVSGCLRTPAGGSSRQTILVVEGERVRSRLLSAREAARLMGVPDAYPLPENYNDAYRIFGDGVAVPVVSWLDEHLLRGMVGG